MADRPSGEPMATTGWPTCRSAELPSAAGVRPETPSALITARSSVAVVPTTVAVAVVPSLNRTSRSVAPATTWLLVRIRPSAVRMTPEPSPPLWLELASTDTVDGSTLAATSCTEPAGAGVRFSDTGGAGVQLAQRAVATLDELEFSCRADRRAAAEAGEQGERRGGGHDHGWCAGPWAGWPRAGRWPGGRGRLP